MNKLSVEKGLFNGLSRRIGLFLVTTAISKAVVSSREGIMGVSTVELNLTRNLFSSTIRSSSRYCKEEHTNVYKQP